MAVCIILQQWPYDHVTMYGDMCGQVGTLRHPIGRAFLFYPQVCNLYVSESSHERFVASSKK